MQPYIFPYIGYFQLINAVDTFVFYDDVNYIKRGWINRNNILVNGAKRLITFPCVSASQNKFINEVEVDLNDKKFKEILTTIELSYKKAPYFDDVYNLVSTVLTGEHENIAQLAAESILKVSTYLKLDKQFKFSSISHPESQGMDRADRLIYITKKENSNYYINAIGGQEIYGKSYFAQNSIKLNFLNSLITEYKQFKQEFIPYLSIIDVMMFNSKVDIEKMLKRYELV